MSPVILSHRCRHSTLFWSAPLEEFAQRFSEQVKLLLMIVHSCAIYVSAPNQYKLT